MTAPTPRPDESQAPAYAFLYLICQRKAWHYSPEGLAGWTEIAWDRFDYVETGVYRKPVADLSHADRENWAEQIGKFPEGWIWPERVNDGFSEADMCPAPQPAAPSLAEIDAWIAKTIVFPPYVPAGEDRPKYYGPTMVRTLRAEVSRLTDALAAETERAEQMHRRAQKAEGAAAKAEEKVRMLLEGREQPSPHRMWVYRRYVDEMLGREAATARATFAEAALAVREGAHKKMWDLLEEVDAQIDLEEEISTEFAQRVQIALWGKAELSPEAEAEAALAPDAEKGDRDAI